MPNNNKTIELRLSKNYFKEDHHYLSYSINCKDGEKGYSGMGWTDKDLEKLKELVDVDKLQNKETLFIDQKIMSKIHTLWSKLRYKKYRSVYVPREANMEFVKIAYEAWENENPLMVEYKKGYEMYPFDEENGCVSEDGLTHVLYIGKSTGKIPILLHLESKCSSGGTSFMFTGIKSIKAIGCNKIAA